MFNWLKKKKVLAPKPTIEYIEQKYGIKLTYPTISLDIKSEDWRNGFYDELESFGCSDIIFDRSWVHRDCWVADKCSINIITGKMTIISNGKCKTCNFYPIRKEYEDSRDIQKIRLKKLNKLNEQDSE